MPRTVLGWVGERKGARMPPKVSRTDVFNAIVAGDVLQLVRFIYNGVDLTRNKDLDKGRVMTPLSLAVRGGRADVLRVLLVQGNYDMLTCSFPKYSNLFAQCCGEGTLEMLLLLVEVDGTTILVSL